MDLGRNNGKITHGNGISYTKAVGVDVARSAFISGKTRSLSFRIQQLDNVLQLLQENGQEVRKAVYKDLGKHKAESELQELENVRMETVGFRRRLDQLAAPIFLPPNLATLPDTAYVQKVPLGIVLIIGAWNFPFMLTMKPFVGALAAGNCIILKPSELAPATSSLLAKLIPMYLDNECYKVVETDGPGTQRLIDYNIFDHIFFTGSPAVGKIILKAAANTLTPVTLELGGKCPCFVDEPANMLMAVRRIVWGRMVNLGQTCAGPDYILCMEDSLPGLVEGMLGVLKEWYGGTDAPKDLSRIINHKHVLRLQALLQSTRGNIIYGGRVHIHDRFVEPTLVVDVLGDDPLMEDEIFGPILPILTVSSVEQAIAFINSRPSPLALYSFSKHEEVNRKLVEETRSGSVCINDLLYQTLFPNLPFGGVGQSGMGRYHGSYSFDTFSHTRSVLSRRLDPVGDFFAGPRYSPVTDGKIAFFKFFIRMFDFLYLPGTKAFSYFITFIIGTVFMLLLIQIGYFKG